jgi:hypothetical protein
MESGDLPEDLAPAKVQFGLVPRFAKAIGRQAKVSRTDARLVVVI